MDAVKIPLKEQATIAECLCRVLDRRPGGGLRVVEIGSRTERIPHRRI